MFKALSLVISWLPALLGVGSPNSISTHNLEYEGPLNTRTVSSIIRDLRSNPDISTLSLTSAGGQADVALVLGEYVRSRRIRVYVPRYCLSACAQYVFLLAMSRGISREAIVGFHTTPSLTFALLEHVKRANQFPDFKSQASVETLQYRRAGLNPRLLSLGLIALEPICIAISRRGSYFDRDRVEVFTSIQAYVPSADLLRRMGLKGNLDNWPKSSSDVQNRMKALPFNAGLHTNYFRDKPRSNEPEKSFKGECPLNRFGLY